jgi:hypothetical protein
LVGAACVMCAGASRPAAWPGACWFIRSFDGDQVLVASKVCPTPAPQPVGRHATPQPLQLSEPLSEPHTLRPYHLPRPPHATSSQRTRTPAPEAAAAQQQHRPRPRPFPRPAHYRPTPTPVPPPFPLPIPCRSKHRRRRPSDQSPHAADALKHHRRATRPSQLQTALCYTVANATPLRDNRPLQKSPGPSTFRLSRERTRSISNARAPSAGAMAEFRKGSP